MSENHIEDMKAWDDANYDSQTEDIYESCEEEKADLDEDVPRAVKFLVTLPSINPSDLNSNQLPIGFNHQLCSNGDAPSSSITDDAMASTGERKARRSVDMVPRIITSQHFRISGQRLLGELPLKRLKLSDIARSIHPVKAVLDRSDLVLPVCEDLVRVNVKTSECKIDMMLEKFKEKMLLKKKIKEEGLMHMGDRMGAVSWITLGEKEDQIARTDCERFEYYVPEGVGRRTRAATRFRNSLQENEILENKTGGMGVFEFNEEDDTQFKEPQTSAREFNKYNLFEDNDDDDFMDDNDAGDKDYEVDKKSKRGKGNRKRGGKGGGRGKGGKRSKTDNNPSIEEFLSPLINKEPMEEGVPPLLAPGVSGYPGQEFIPLGRKTSSPRTRPGERWTCPLCCKEYADMVLLETHASACQG